MAVIATAAATKIVGEIAKELVAAGIDASKTGLARWKNVNAHRDFLAGALSRIGDPSAKR